MADDRRTGPTLDELMARARARLTESACATPDLDCRVLAGHAFGLDAAGLLLRGRSAVSAEEAARFEHYLARRVAGEPVFRILGRRPFYDHEFELSRETLEPRPDTEALVDLAAEAFRAATPRGERFVFADVGTGTGAIAVSLLALFPMALGVAVDLSAGTLATARRNAAAADVAPRFIPVCSNYLSAIAPRLDAVVSNPPYIPSGEIETLSREVRDFDPRLALDGGADGLDAYRVIAGESAACLGAGGGLLFEIGRGQEGDVSLICRERGFSLVGERTDYAGIVRALWFRRDSAPE